MQFYCIGDSGGSKNQPVSGVTTIASRSATHLLRIELIRLLMWPVECGPFLFKLLDIGGYWIYADPEHPNMLNGWHVRWVCWSCKNWNVFSFHELCTDSCNMGPCIIMLQHEVMVVDEWHTMGHRISSRYLCAFKMPSINAPVSIVHNIPPAIP